MPEPVIVVHTPVVVSQHANVGGGHGFGVHTPVPTWFQPGGQVPVAAMGWHAPVVGSQHSGTCWGWHGFGLQVVPLMMVPLHGVPGTQATQLPAVSQHTLGAGHGFGLQVPGPTLFQPGGHAPDTLMGWQAPEAGSQQIGPG